MAKKKKASKPEQVSAEPKTSPEKPKKEPKEGGSLLLTVLTVLLLVVAVGELALVGFAGFGAFRGRLAQQAYEAQLSAGGSQTAVPVSTVSYAGPWLTTENGRVTWRREDGLTGSGVIGSGISMSGTTAIGGNSQTEYPRTPASPPRSWVQTIDSDIA